MQTPSEPTSQVLTPDLWLEMVEKNDPSELAAFLSEQHEADIADLITQVSYDFQTLILDLLSDQLSANVLSELDGTTQAKIFDSIPDHRLPKIVGYLASDDATDMLGQIDRAQALEILSKLPQRKRRHVTELLEYDKETAGGIMAKEAASADVRSSVSKVIERLRETAGNLDDIYNVYLVEPNGRLAGWVTLKDLILARPEQAVAEIMEQDFVKVHVSMDREEVAGLFRKYDLASAPVIDDAEHFIGRILHDDVLDVITEEADEDIARLSGQEEIDPSERSIFRNIRYRLPWLLLGLLGGFAAAVVLAHFEGYLAKITSLIFFLPLVAAMGGNAGIQTSSIMVRGLATGEISGFGLPARLLRELGISLLAGFVCGVVIFGISYVWQSDLKLSAVISISLMLVIVLAAFIGAVVPLLLKKFGLDPALATGPFITTTNDILGLFIYLAIASFLLFG